MNWGFEDYIAATVLLCALGAGLLFTSRLKANPKSKILVAAALVVVFLAVWAELAVGLLD